MMEVNEENKAEYIDDKILFILNRCVFDELSAMRAGLTDIVSYMAAQHEMYSFYALFGKIADCVWN